MCEGQTIEDHLAWIGDSIERAGWALQGVATGSSSKDWAYTIGLMENYDHAELVVSGVDATLASRMLNAMAAGVATGERYEPGELIEFGDGDVVARFVKVHPSYFAGDKFAMWFNYYASTGRGMNVAFTQAAVLDPNYCDMHQRGTGWLDRPVVTARTGDRAKRRPKKRRR
ncbi:MAG: hypothetical protein QOG90_1763 [Actinomycetota bacterium]|jgi:hypothetical protein